MTNYAQGRAREYQYRDYLLGLKPLHAKEETLSHFARYTEVFRTAGSHGVCDLIAVRRNYNPDVLLVQIKKGNGKRPGSATMKELAAFRSMRGWPVQVSRRFVFYSCKTHRWYTLWEN